MHAQGPTNIHRNRHTHMCMVAHTGAVDGKEGEGLKEECAMKHYSRTTHGQHMDR